jgi:hypothetical protein
MRKEEQALRTHAWHVLVVLKANIDTVDEMETTAGRWR